MDNRFIDIGFKIEAHASSQRFNSACSWLQHHKIKGANGKIARLKKGKAINLGDYLTILELMGNENAR